MLKEGFFCFAFADVDGMSMRDSASHDSSPGYSLLGKSSYLLCRCVVFICSFSLSSLLICPWQIVRPCLEVLVQVSPHHPCSPAIFHPIIAVVCLPSWVTLPLVQERAIWSGTVMHESCLQSRASCPTPVIFPS